MPVGRENRALEQSVSLHLSGTSLLISPFPEPGPWLE